MESATLSHLQILFWLVVGAALAALFLRLATLRRQGSRGILAVGLMIAAWIYVFFGGISEAGSGWLAIELAGVLLFSLFALLGIRRSGYWLAAGWGLHTVWDLGLHFVGPGRSLAPARYAVACLSFDLVVSAWIVWRLRTSSRN
ncbi:MAG: DUF6010 family protein [Acidobacteriota bacterium]